MPDHTTRPRVVRGGIVQLPTIWQVLARSILDESAATGHRLDAAKVLAELVREAAYPQEDS